MWGNTVAVVFVALLALPLSQAWTGAIVVGMDPVEREKKWTARSRVSSYNFQITHSNHLPI